MLLSFPQKQAIQLQQERSWRQLEQSPEGNNCAIVNCKMNEQNFNLSPVIPQGQFNNQLQKQFEKPTIDQVVSKMKTPSNKTQYTKNLNRMRELSINQELEIEKQIKSVQSFRERSPVFPTLLCNSPSSTTFFGQDNSDIEVNSYYQMPLKQNNQMNEVLAGSITKFEVMNEIKELAQDHQKLFGQQQAENMNLDGNFVFHKRDRIEIANEIKSLAEDHAKLFGEQNALNSNMNGNYIFYKKDRQDLVNEIKMLAKRNSPIFIDKSGMYSQNENENQEQESIVIVQNHHFSAETQSFEPVSHEIPLEINSQIEFKDNDMTQNEQYYGQFIYSENDIPGQMPLEQPIIEQNKIEEEYQQIQNYYNRSNHMIELNSGDNERNNSFEIKFDDSGWPNENIYNDNTFAIEY